MKTFGKNRDGFTSNDIKYMKLAVKLAEKGRGKTSPNPMVVAIIIPITVVKKICPIPVIIDIFPRSLNIRVSRFIPTKNNRNAIPSSEKTISKS